MPTANLYIYAIKDDALPEVINKVTNYGIHVHTSEAFNGCFENAPISGFIRCKLSKKKQWISTNTDF